MRKLFAVLIFVLALSASASAQFKGSLFDGIPAASPTPVEIASRDEVFTQKLLQGAGGSGPGPQINVASRIIVKASYPTGTRGNVFISSTTGVPYACKSATCLANGTGWVSMDASGATTSPGGSNQQVQFNDSGAFGASSGLTFNKSTLALTVGGSITAANILPDGVATRDVGSRAAPYANLHVRTAVEFNAATGDNNSFAYSDQIGPVFHDDNIPNNLIFNLQGLTGSKTATWPNASGNVVLDAATQTLTNKSIDAGQLTGSVLDARLSANVPLINGTNAFTGTNGFSQPVGIGFGSTAPPSGPMLSVASTVSTSPRGIASMQFSTDTSGARLGFFKARGTPASPTTVVSGDTLGRLMFRGYDGSVYNEMASIEALSTGTVGSLRVPTQLVFATGTDAAPSVLTTALTLGADQSATFAGTVVATSPKITTGINDANGNSMLAFSPTASAANGVTLTNGAAGTPAVVTVSATGASASIDLALTPKNAPTGVVRTTGRFVAAGANGASQFIIRDTTNSKDFYFYNNNDGLMVFPNSASQILDLNNTGTLKIWGSLLPNANGANVLGSSSLGWQQAYFDKTITAAGTTAPQTINKVSGSVNLAAAATSLVVTNSRVDANSNIQCTVATNDTTTKSVQCVAASGSFTIYPNAAPTAEVRINFWIVN